MIAPTGVFDTIVFMPSDWQSVIDDFKAVVPMVDFWSLRLVFDETEEFDIGEQTGIIVHNPASSQQTLN